MTLNELQIGESAKILSVGCSGALRQHFLDMGLIPGTNLTLVKLAPMGDPMELQVHNYELTLRLADAREITICKTPKPPENIFSSNKNERPVEHPGLGQDGVYHKKIYGTKLPENIQLTFGLVGNQNSGKTTLFNQLTGANQHVGNFPGVTVDRKDGAIRGISKTMVTDLPGIYSMSPYSSEELVTRQFILQEKPKGLINIVDATNMERNLYLTMQLMELDIPMVIAVNVMDEMRENGGSVRLNEMERMLGVPVIPISALKNEGIDELIDHAIHVASYQEKPRHSDFCDPFQHNGAVHRCLHGIMHLIEDYASRTGVPVRFAASKLVEGDPLILEHLSLEKNEKDMIEHIIRQMEEERGLDRAAAIADMRYHFIEKVCSNVIIKPAKNKSRLRSQKIDRILTGKYTAIPCFIFIMSLIFWLTFGPVGSYMASIFEKGIAAITNAVDEVLIVYGLNSAVRSLIVDGICNGVGSVIGFLPVIITLFFFLSILEDSGYMARVAFVMDKLLRKIGLSGRSIVPMLIGFGCTVPGVMATRTLPSDRDRKLTILLTPFMSCTAKVPIYAFLTKAFFPEHGTIVMIGLYFTGILIGILMAIILRSSIFRGEPVPFVMELPNYRLPGIKNVVVLLWDKAKDFITRAFSVIFLATIIIWFLQTFDLQLNVTADSQNSLLARIAGWISPIFLPLGFSSWQISTALITGIMAKESVVSTLTVLLGRTSLSQILSPLAALSLLVFTLLYTPCIAAISTIKREMGIKWAAIVMAVQFIIAWIAAFLIHTVGILLGFG